MMQYQANLTDQLKENYVDYPLLMQKKTEELTTYADHFDLPYRNVDYKAGYVLIKDKQIFLQTFAPQNFSQTAYLFHGYMDHAGYFRHVIAELLQRRVRVIAWDQPGFGLSAGRRGYCDSFSEYTEVAEYIIKFIQNLREPIQENDEDILIGHSAGCAQILSLMHESKILRPSKLVFLTPLVRCAFYPMVKLLSPILIKFRERIPRKLKKASHDEDFIRFLRSDPLESKYVELAWPNAMLRWEKQIDQLKINQETPLLVIQGFEDSTIHWRYNLEWLNKRFAKLEVKIIEKARHHVHNEIKPYRNECLKAIREFI